MRCIVSLGTAALVALGAGAAMAIAACTSTDESVDVPVYGGPAVPWEDAGSSRRPASPEAGVDAQGERDASREDGALEDGGDGDASTDAGNAYR